ncbi:MAG: C4-dicarboxylate transporter DctA [Acidobacteriia bacterium]|nr:C4-dicarboxylate transporter DctA [Terriglobia bacterium]
MPRRPWYRDLYVQVLVAIALGIFTGHFFPKAGIALKPLGDGFIALIKMMIGPVIFCVLVQGIGSMTDMKKVGRVGLKTLVYFEIVSVSALLIGMVVAQAGQPGRGLNINPAALDAKSVAAYVSHAKDTGLAGQLLRTIPATFLDAFIHDDFLQVVLLAILCGFAISRLGESSAGVTRAVGVASKVCFGIIRMIVQLAPIGAFGAMAFTVGRYDLAALSNLAKLIGTFYLTSALFVLLILGTIAYLAGFSLLRFLAYIKDELLIVLGTSSSETVIPDMLRKLERLGAPSSIAGLVFPMGYSFNTDGANIYITLAVLFLAQATNVHLSLGQEVRVLLFAMIASTGGAGVPGGAFVKVAAVLSVFPEIPVQALALLLGVDKFMSECRALTNVIGNGVATLVVSRWEGELDVAKMREVMGGK